MPMDEHPQVCKLLSIPILNILLILSILALG